ncbi:uncharacterized protein PpBr36_09294 [Pyricularia pennisetigena]|uniref:uncharacterized protein n=1 Tax=Pyricularia pennisetigena TaxID=1578925 RepID=UPI001150B960|nr:uncharacterized protein PpBr36_09294 [Pyricularia pennisetigena]TLS21651.1 hypothetical protein PpBr36_09294 [Pyricularia pennisetigena]
MPPRLPGQASSWRPVAESVSSHFFAPSAPATSTIISSTQTSTQRCPNNARAFSATAPASGRLGRKQMRQWMKQNEHKYKNVDIRSNQGPQYISGNSSQPFPLNPHFRSAPVLSESARELVWEKVMIKGEPMKSVSAELGIDIRRIGAVVRLKEVEKDWIANNKPLARPYAKAFMSMLPQTTYDDPNVQKHHEQFNEVVVHPYTQQQLFFPVSESRDFTREDAAKAFNRHLKSTDERIPHPELVQMERQINVEGVAPLDAAKAFRQATAEAERKIAERAANAAKKEASLITSVHDKRGVEFRFKDYNVDEVGHNGRGLKGVGVRYGVASYDRKRGEVKIPTSVE